MSNQTINLNYTPQNFQPCLYYSQGDVGRVFQINLQGIDVPSGATVTLRATKPSGLGFNITADSVTDNVATFTTVETMTNEYGRFPAEVHISNGSVEVGSANFLMVGKKNPHPDTTVDGDAEQVIPQLTLLVERVEDAASSVLDMTVNATTLAAGSQATYSYDEATNTATFGIPEGQAGSGAVGTVASAYSASKTYAVGDYAIQNGNLYRCTTAITIAESFTAAHWTQVVLADDVTDLKSDLGSMLTENGEVSLFVQGGMYTSGAEVDAANRLRSNAFSSSRIIRATANNGYSFLVFAYQNGTFKGAWAGATFEVGGAASYVDSFSFAPYNYDFRLVVKRTDNANIAVSEAENIVFYYCTDEKLLASYKPADAKVTGDLIRWGFSSISAENRITLYRIDDVADLTAGKAVNGSGRVISEANSYCTENMISILDANLHLNTSIRLINTGYYYQYVAFYDTNGTFLSRVGGQATDEISSSIPSNAKYFRWTLSYVGANNVSSCELVLGFPLSVKKGSPQNKWYVLGDSISAGYYSMTKSMADEMGVVFDYVSPVTTEGGEQTGSVWDTSLSHNYWNYANEYFLNRDLVGKAYPGQGYFRTAVNEQNGVYVVSHNDFSDAGMITVAWGFNDWHYNQPRGTHNLIDDSVPYPTENYDTSQITTVNQAIWYCLGELIRQAPNAKIVVQTPMNGWAYGGDFSTNWGIGYEMSDSGKLSDIHDDIVYWANYYGLQILEMTYNNSIVNRRNIKTTIIDGSHPSDEAHKQLGRHVAIALKYC